MRYKKRVLLVWLEIKNSVRLLRSAPSFVFLGIATLFQMRVLLRHIDVVAVEVNQVEIAVFAVV